MKKMLVMAVALVLVALICAPAFSAVVFQDTCDYATYGSANKGTPGNGWTAWGSQSQMDYRADKNRIGDIYGVPATSTGSGALHEGAQSDKNYRWTSDVAGEFDAVVWIYDSGGTSTSGRLNAFMEWRGYKNRSTANVTATTDLVQMFAVGIYNSGDGQNYNSYSCRVYAGSSTGWVRMTGVTPTVGWHKFGVSRDSTGIVKFYVDDVERKAYSGTAKPTASTMNVVAVGQTSGSSSTYGEAYYDGFYVADKVPEPSSMLAFATGLVGLLGLVRRRRA